MKIRSKMMKEFIAAKFFLWHIQLLRDEDELIHKLELGTVISGFIIKDLKIQGLVLEEEGALEYYHRGGLGQGLLSLTSECEFKKIPVEKFKKFLVLLEGNLSPKEKELLERMKALD